MLCDYLAEFVVVSREGSLTKAALDLSLSQSSLSRHISTLEASLGMALLNRNADGVTLTDDGKRVLTYADTILESARAIEEYAKNKHRNDSVRMSGLFDFPTFAHVLYDAGKNRTVGGTPGPVKVISMDDLPAGSLRSAFETGTCTFYVTYERDTELADLDDSFRVAPLVHPGIVAVMDAKNALAGRTSLRPEDLSGQVLLTAESNLMRARKDWIQTSALLEEHGIPFYVQGGIFTCEADWYQDFGKGILLMPQGSRGLQIHESFGKAIIPVEGIRHTFVAVWRAGDATAEWLASVDMDGPLGFSD